jgi:DNA-binding CsgD family transcriptional regulator/tetratricopeptide (TPR) repeat protein
MGRLVRKPPKGKQPVEEPFVGRAGELAVLGRLFERTGHGHGQVALVVGVAGIGKTALTRRCLSLWRARALSASGDPDETSLTGGLLDQLAREAGVPEAKNLLGLLETGAADPLSAGSALLSMLRAMLIAGPLVAVVDDAQWSDELSLRALSFAVRRMHADHCMCLVITRPEDLPRLPPGLLRAVDDRGTRIDLAALDAGNVADLSELAGAGRLSHRAAEQLREHAAGIPLHVKELLHDLPAAVLQAPGSVLPAPRSLETLVLSRLACCAPETVRLVVAAAILGTDTGLTDVAALAGLADPLPALQEAGQQRLLEPGAASGRRCVFPRSMIRAAVYRDIGMSRRAELHRAAAGLTTGLAALGHRAAGCRGTDPGLAADLAVQALAELDAGRRAEAAGHFLTSVQVDERGPGRDERLLTAVGLLIDLGDAAKARTYSDEVMALPPSAPRSLVLGRLAMLGGEYRRAEDWLADAWAALEMARPPATVTEVREGAAVAACQLALMLLGLHRTDDAGAWARRATDTAVTRFTHACACAVHGGCLVSVGRTDDAKALLEAELAGDDEGPADTMIRASLAAALYRGDDLNGARAQLNAAAAGYSGLPMTHQLEARLLRLAVDYRAGAWDQAAAEGERLLVLIDDLDQGWLRARAHLMAVYVAAGRGEWRRAADHAEAAAAHPAAGPGAGSLELADARTAIAVASDDPAGIVAAVAGLGDLGPLARLEPTRLMFWPAYAHALARLGRLAEADRALRPFEELAHARARRSAMAAAGRARGYLEAVGQRPDAACAALAASVKNLEGLAIPFEEAQTRLEYGRFLRHAGQRRSAIREIGAARSLFAGLGAQPFLDYCDTEFGHDVHAPQSAFALPLTPRQLTVARAVASGKSNRDVATDLYISVKTVEFHVHQILTRLSIDSRAEIAAALAASAR